jgi:hypothetical protein
MIKLNGNLYLTAQEVYDVLNEVTALFKTSHRAILPQKIPYIDRDFVEEIRERSKYIQLIIRNSYNYYETHLSLKQIFSILEYDIYDEEICSKELSFLKRDITEKQKEKYRKQYHNFLINCFLKESIKKFNLLLTK